MKYSSSFSASSVIVLKRGLTQWGLGSWDIFCSGTLQAQEHRYLQRSICTDQKQILSLPKIYELGRHLPHV